MTEPDPMPLPQPGPAPRSPMAAVGLVAIALLTAAAAVAGSLPGRTTTLRHIPQIPAGVAPSGQRTEVAASSSLPLAAAPAGSTVTVYPRPGEGWIALTARVCGSSANWRQQQALNGGAAWLYIGRAYRLDCAGPTSPGAGAPTNNAWVKPISGMGCFQPNGSREFGVWRGNHSHGGIDLGAPVGAYYGTPIRAIHGGVAHHGYQAGGAGTYVWVDHGDSTASFYFHMASRAVGNGARVNAGQVIGYVGASGNATSAHVHLEVKINGGRVDPVVFLRQRGVEIQCR